MSDIISSENALEALRAAHPWPAERPDFRPFLWSLDGGGRGLLIDLIRERDVRLMIEIGVFLGGSSMEWLNAAPNLRVIGVEPGWGGISDYFVASREAYRDDPRGMLDLKGMSDDEFIAQMRRPDAAQLALLSNLWDHKDRYIPVRGYSPAPLYDIHACGVTPDLVYIDSDKTMVELPIIYELWPECIITGDDWTWRDDDGVYPVRENVMAHADKHDLRLTAARQTWTLTPDRAFW